MALILRDSWFELTPDDEKQHQEFEAYIGGDNEADEQMGGRKTKPAKTFRHFDIFIDGSTTDQAKTFKKKHLRRGGMGVYHPASGTKIARPYPFLGPTNNKCEYLAAIIALRWVRSTLSFLSLQELRKVTIVLYTDSQLLLKSMTQWLPTWKKRGWKKSDGQPVKNREFLEELDHLVTDYFPLLKWVKVKAHRCKPPRSAGKHSLWLWYGNFEADRLANDGRHRAERKNPAEQLFGSRHKATPSPKRAKKKKKHMLKHKRE